MPVFNIVYADRQDTIFYHCGGLYPVRKPGWDYLNIVPGDTSLTLWKRFYPLDSIPSVLQPRSGYIYNTNSSPYLCSGPSDDPNPRKYPTTTGLHLNVDNDRSIRFRELVQEHARLDFNTFKGLKYDLEYPKHSAGAARKTQQRFARIDPKNVPPELAEALRIVSTCPLNGKLDNTQAPLFAITVYHLMEKLQFDRVRFMLYGLDTPDDTELLEGLRWAQAYLLRHHKTLTPPLAQVQRIVRGNKELPTPGLSQNLNSCDVDLTPNGILRVNRNSSFIQFAHYRNGKLQRLETAVPYGASNNPKSEHYADQMELHASFQTKPMTLDLAKVRQSARLTYRPKSTEGLHRYTQPSATTDDNE
jgi:acyl-homoserine-lactone acylase